MGAKTRKIIAAKEGAIGRITFNTPERRNAIALEMWQAMPEILADFAADDAVRVIVVNGAGGKAFSAGADISQFEDVRSSEQAIADYNADVGKAQAALSGAGKPTIAEIQGLCVGGGLAVALCCDLRLASDDSRFAIPAAKLGLGYGIDGLRPLVDLVGPSHAKEIFFTARLFDAAEALGMGLVNRVVPAADLAADVVDYAETIGANAPLTVQAVKTIVGEVVKDAGDRDMDLCRTVVDRCFASADYVEGRQAFMEKRKPNFQGR
jgi:enoyl-CoA hydratase/carnithine racemase